MGSWKIIAMRPPRSSRRRSGRACSRSSPSKSTWPAAMRPGGCGTRPMIASAVTLLPQPDSPTRPRVRPASSARLTPSTAGTVERRPASSTSNSTLSPVTSSNLIFDERAVGDPRRARLRRQAAHERLVALEAHAVETAQLGDRLRVVVDADVEERIFLGGVDEQRCGLLAALVAARRLACREGAHEALAERPPGFAERARGFLQPRSAGQHVPRDGKALTRQVPAPVDARLAGV